MVSESMQFDVVIVGAGPAGLAAAIRLRQLAARHEREISVCVLDKASELGAHTLSGANMRPSAMRELFPDLPESEWPVYGEVHKDSTYLLTKKRKIKLMPPPPNFKNHGNFVTSVAELSRWLAEKAEEMGVYVLTETAALHRALGR